MKKSVFLSFVLLFLFSLKSCNIMYFLWWDRRQETVGEIVSTSQIIGAPNRTLITYKYFVEGDKYYRTFFDHDWINIANGRKYKVYYDPKRPKSNVMELNEPVFDDESKFKNVRALILSTDYARLSKTETRLRFDYKYTVEGSTYETSSYFLIEDIDSSITKKNINQFYRRYVEIKYDSLNPMISTIKVESLKSLIK